MTLKWWWCLRCYTGAILDVDNSTICVWLRLCVFSVLDVIVDVDRIVVYNVTVDVLFVSLLLVCLLDITVFLTIMVFVFLLCCFMCGFGYVRKCYQNAVWIKDNWNSKSTWCVWGIAGPISVFHCAVCCSILQWSLLGVIYLSCMADWC